MYCLMRSQRETDLLLGGLFCYVRDSLVTVFTKRILSAMVGNYPPSFQWAKPQPPLPEGKRIDKRDRLPLIPPTGGSSYASKSETWL